MPDLKKIIEALLFVADTPLSIKQIAAICEAEPEQIKPLLHELAAAYSEQGFTLEQIAGGWQFMTAQAYAPYIEKLYRPKMQQLSKAAMETLAIIAYKQPITRAEIAAIRRVEADSIVNKLLEKNLIKDMGRRLGPGRAVLYGTTDDFLSFFGLNTLADLPNIDEDNIFQLK